MASQSPPPLPADAEVLRNIEVLAAFVAKTGAQFEQLARVNTAGDPKFGFLLSDGPPGSEAARSHAFYQWKKQRLEQRLFATDGSDDIQLKICAMIDEARTPLKAPSLETAPDEKKSLLPLGAIERNRLEAKAGGVQKTEPSLSNHSKCKPECPPFQKGTGDVKAPSSTAPSKRKADSVTAGSIIKKGTPHEDLGRLPPLSLEAKNKVGLSTASNKMLALPAAPQERSRRGQPVQGTKEASIIGDPHKRKPVIGKHGQKVEVSREDERNSPGGGLSDEVRHAGDICAVEATEKHHKEQYGLRLLKSTLADYVKEVLKPAWKEGSMSKEAFKSIVKKVVDKVIGSLQAHQIPKSQENVDQYMTQSEAKISKLVQGYVDRFKKNE
ncbi:hypothetical protein L7F22_037183 [Adiantum nelumboides]|nr:hypothetical protein [Adiantum nelumboides]